MSSLCFFYTAVINDSALGAEIMIAGCKTSKDLKNLKGKQDSDMQSIW